MAGQYGKMGWCSVLKATEAPLQASLRSGKGNIRKERVACRGYPCVFGDFPLKKGIYCNENIARQAMQQNFPGQWKIAEEQAEIKRWKCCQVFVFFSQKELLRHAFRLAFGKIPFFPGDRAFPEGHAHESSLPRLLLGPAHKSCPACEFPMFQSDRQMPLSSPFNVHAHSCSPWSVLCMAFLWLLSMTPVAWSTDCSLACWQVPWLFPYVFCLKKERGGRLGLCAFVVKTVKFLKLLKW